MSIPNLSNCFGCGKDNPHGLHLVNRYEGEKSVMELTVDKFHCGFPGILHGGLSFTMLDEVMHYAIFNKGLESVTVSSQVDFLSPGKEGAHLCIEGWIEKIDGKYVEGASQIIDTETDSRPLLKIA